MSGMVWKAEGSVGRMLLVEGAGCGVEDEGVAC